MATGWRSLPLDAPWFPTAEEGALNRGSAELRNVLVDDTKGHVRLPELVPLASLDVGGRVHVGGWQGGLLASTTDAFVFGVDPPTRAAKLKGSSLVGGGRASLAQTDEHLIMAAGGEVQRFDGAALSRLSPDCPLGTHVGYCSGYVLVLETGTGVVWYSEPGFYDKFEPMSTFSADDRPDRSLALTVTRSNDVVMMGEEGVEVYSVSPDVTQPFFRRYTVQGGLVSPDAWCETQEGLWLLTSRREVVSLGAGGQRPVSEPVQRLLDGVEDWDGTWLGSIEAEGQRLLVVQVPSARLTLVYDRRKKGWSDATGRGGSLWPGRSLATTRQGCFAGGEDGRVWRVGGTPAPGERAEPSQMRWRSAPYPAQEIVPGAGVVEVQDLRVRMVRPSWGGEAKVRFRARVDDEPWLMWNEQEFGADDEDGRGQSWLHFGPVGSGESVQMEYQIDSPGPVRVAKAEILASAHG